MRDFPVSRTSPELSQKLQEFGKLWAESGDRPRIPLQVKRCWDQLIDGWADSDLPLVVRKSTDVRGKEVIHSISRRRIILSDNSPAQWTYMRALQGLTYSLSAIRGELERDNIPFAFATKRVEKVQMKYKRTLQTADKLNKHGWKLCHIEPVGLRLATPLNELAMDLLLRHFRLLLKPSNHFLVPLSWGGLGEVPEVIEEIRRFETSDNHSSEITT